MEAACGGAGARELQNEAAPPPMPPMTLCVLDRTRPRLGTACGWQLTVEEFNRRGACTYIGTAHACVFFYASVHCWIDRSRCRLLSKEIRIERSDAATVVTGGGVSDC